jgi:hypothetical protein
MRLTFVQSTDIVFYRSDFHHFAIGCSGIFFPNAFKGGNAICPHEKLSLPNVILFLKSQRIFEVVGSELT